MSDLTIPAPSGVGDSAPSQPSTDTRPPGESLAGEPKPLDEADGDTTRADDGDAADQQQEEGDEKTRKERRKERNDRRRQEYLRRQREIPHRLSQIEQQLDRLQQFQQTPLDIDDIVDPDERIAETVGYKLEQRQARAAEAQLRAHAEAAREELRYRVADAWQEASEEARARIPDFDQVVTDDTPIHARAAPFIVQSEHAAEIAYWLGKNPKQAAALYDAFEIEPARALIELGRIEAQLRVVPGRSHSTAPPPPTVVSGGSSPPGFNPERGDVDEMARFLKKAGLIR